MSVFGGIEEHDKEFEYKLMRQKFISIGGTERNGKWTTFEIRPRSKYKKEYEGNRLITFDYLMFLIHSKCKWSGYEDIPPCVLETAVGQELIEHNISIINYPMQLIGHHGSPIIYKNVPFYVIPNGMIDKICDKIFKWGNYDLNLDTSRLKI